MKKTLRQLRLQKDITQEELARLANVNARTISMYETSIERLRGASYSRLDRIAKALDAKVSDIFLGNTSKK